MLLPVAGGKGLQGKGKGSFPLSSLSHGRWWVLGQLSHSQNLRAGSPVEIESEVGRSGPLTTLI